MCKEIRYAALDGAAHKVEIRKHGRLVMKVKLYSTYVGGESVTEIEPEEAGRLLDSMRAHRVSASEYQARINRLKGKRDALHKRTA